jgi:hypothetical protein
MMKMKILWWRRMKLKTEDFMVKEKDKAEESSLGAVALGE